jgi:type VI secretion system protein ImpF
MASPNATTSKPTQRLQPSLLDRLTDLEPKRLTEAPEDRVLDKRALRAAVLRDLSWLFNAVDYTDQFSATEWPEVAKSVLNFGLPQLSGGYVSSVDIPRLEATIRQTILLFEPRIIPASLRVTALLDGSILDLHNQLSLSINGLLWAQPVPLEIHLRTQIDLEHNTVNVVDASGSGI